MQCFIPTSQEELYIFGSYAMLLYCVQRPNRHVDESPFKKKKTESLCQISIIFRVFLYSIHVKALNYEYEEQ